MKYKLKILIPVFFLSIILSLSLMGCTQETEKKSALVSNSVAENHHVDTIKRNESIEYNVTLDTLVGKFSISVNNKNLYKHYIHQDFNLNDSIVVRNFYPEMKSTIIIKNGEQIIFEHSYLKKDFPKGNVTEFLQNATIKSFAFYYFDEEKNEIEFRATLQVPNTDFENDFSLIVSKDGKSTFRWIDYESE